MHHCRHFFLWGGGGRAGGYVRAVDVEAIVAEDVDGVFRGIREERRRG